MWIAFLLALALAGAACAGREKPALPVAEVGDDLVVMTFNIHHGEGVDGTVDLDSIAAVIRHAGADVVGLQEVDRHFDGRSGFEDQLTALGESLDMHTAFAATLDLPPHTPGDPRRHYGNTLLSRYPISASSGVALPAPDGAEPRAVLSATIDIDDSPLSVLVTHLGAGPDDERERQAVALSEMVADDGTRTVLLVDANDQPGSRTLRTLRTDLVDAWATAAGHGFTHPADEPSRRIDYVLVTSDLRMQNARVEATSASDHLPVVVQLTVPTG